MINRGFWQELKNKGMILGLSPMDGVTDAPFRYMVARYGMAKKIPNHKFSNSQIADTGVQVLFTEFISVDGLHYATGERKEKMLQGFVKARDLGDLGSKPYEVAQVFGSTPEYFAEAAELIEELGFDGMDINMGCPAKNVSEHGCGAGLIRTPALAQEIVRVAQGATKLPVSVKTRIGVTDKSEMEEWITAIMEVNPAVLSLHGRTLKQMYMGEADWEYISRAGEIVHKAGGVILGNGDVKTVESAKLKVASHGVDGVLIGRAAEGNPAVFLGVDEPTLEQRKDWMVEHAKIYEKVFGMGNFMPVRKHLAWYCKGFPGAVETRGKLVRANSASEVEEIVH